MATSVTLPALGESVTEGTVTRWLKQPGDEVAVDEPLLEVSTDKVDTEIPSPVAGTLIEVKVAEDETVEVGAELALVGEAGESTGADTGQGAAEQGGDAAAQPAEPAQEQPAQEQPAQAAAEEPPPPQQAPEPAPAAQAQPAAADQGGAETGSGTPVTLPALGESVTEGTVTRWLKQPGDEVAVDEPLLEVSTDKVDTEIPSPVAGTLIEVKVAEDETVEVGAELALVGEAGTPAGGGQAAAAPEQAAPEQPTQQQPVQQPTQQQAPAAATVPPQPPGRDDAAATTEQVEDVEQEPAPARPGPAPSPRPAAKPEPKQPAQAQSGDGTPYVTPLVRKLAAEHGVDLSTVTGSGIGGRIRKQDVQAAAEAAKAAPEPSAGAPAGEQPAAEPAAEPSPLRGTTEKLSRMRKVIAKRVHESLQQTAQLTTVVEIDVTSVARLRDRVKDDFARREGVKLSFLPFFAKASIEALKQHPKINASIDVEQGEVTYHDRENLVLAVDTDQGLLVPVIKDAGDLNIAGLSRRISEVAEKARTNKLTPDEATGGTFTLTNTGSRGALFDTPIFFQPQVAILGTGSVVKRPMVIDDPNLGETIAVRHMVYFALSYDHRLIDGADAARFLATIRQRLESGRFEADLGLS
ncbi:2-oxoglutarate dehydrogenase E2 component [Haloactinopolyspora alba]|uniref:Dihydrolipoamide acetyltransferase component of pyruvate dehydrogenase complex n=2 Tax=Haloactinopolyspora alba TaxID=648780 RepID=A0A2P8DRA2_9ACTN|nr:2-oxoglutarate dehydrogenase, E2 component, dihydrolipoamide succinyltransferase [Haloactinopolyspora alba]PSK99740.1 2-oxoglutarate dehydrogenase E2 component [Haloactinopolyspora alba]